ncbi:MAG: Asp-tRNA(Asn)/Glu-tRNA(Gln) amidotransferase subunit GatC [Patescibacteria group bacterium]|jgi:aspartyl-tRNA(Asn)/glutamyl-tRNA(Gln) amidotransferase subunit C
MNPKTLSKDGVKHVAELVQIPLSDSELEAIAPQLSEAVEYVEVLNELDVTQTPPTSQVTGLINVFRDDMVKPSLTQEEALKNSKQTVDGYFAVPAVIEKE